MIKDLVLKTGFKKFIYVLGWGAFIALLLILI